MTLKAAVWMSKNDEKGRYDRGGQRKIKGYKEMKDDMWK